MDAKARSTMLKVVGIIFLIWGIIGIIFSIVAMVGGAAVTALGVAAGTGDDAATAAGLGVLVMVAGILGIVGGIVGILAGVLGIKHNSNVAKAKSFIVWGIVYCVLELLSQLGGLNIWSLIFGLILPAIYIYGGVMMKKDAPLKV